MPPTILQKDASILRQIAEAVPLENLKTAEFLELVANLKTALAAEPDGVAIAAAQIGQALRLFVVAKKVVGPEQADELIFINPTIIKRAKKTKMLEEGCLSVRGVYGLVKRAAKVSVSARDLNGQKFTYHASGFLAQIFQHEIDHLNGILFTDKTSRWLTRAVAPHHE